MTHLWNSIIYWLMDRVQNRTFGARRSPRWEHLRRQHLIERPFCAVCETIEDCEVHHIKPFFLFPELELDPSNLITLCREHHYFFGHLNDWSSYNPDVETDALIYRGKLRNRP